MNLNGIKNLKHRDQGSFFLIAGPCVIESKEICYEIAERLCQLSDQFKLPFIFKASYKKANRTSLGSFTGIGDTEGLELLHEIGNTFNIPTLTDIHSESEAYIAAKYVDILQIPAFLCRQTEILVAAAKTGKHVNIKKGQFLSPESMQFAVEKIRECDNQNVMITERGSTFGFQDLVVDFRGIPVMQRNNCPVMLDITHSLQQPNQSGGVTGGRPELIETIAKAGVAAGVDGIFIETHPDPTEAKSDGANMLKLDLMEDLLKKLIKIRKVI